MKKLKILFVCNNFKPSWEAGGEVRAVYDLSQALINIGHEVTVYTNDCYRINHGVVTNIPVEVDGVIVYYFSNFFKKFPSLHLPPAPLIIWKRRLEDIKRYDIVHIHGHRSILEIVISRHAYLQSIPYIIQAHGSAKHHDKHILKTIFDRMVGDRIIKRAATIIISTPKEEEEYRSIKAPTDNFNIAANIIDSSLFSPLPQKGLFRTRFRIQREKILILFVGRINEIKSLDMLIDAVASIKKVIPSIVLALVGPVDDSYYQKKLYDSVINHNIEDSVLFCGPLYGSEKVEAYVDADIYVQPSRYESFSNTIVEALAVGTPVIYSKDCNISDKLNGMGIGVEHNIKAFAEAINILATDSQLREKYAENARNKVTEIFDLNRVVLDYIDIYQQVL